MKKITFALCFMFVFFMTIGFAGAEGVALNNSASSEWTSIDKQASKKLCDQENFLKVAYETGNPNLPYLLQANQKACLDKCSQAFDSCMSGAGDSPDAKFRCEDKRRICALRCDNEWYSKVNF